jgi:oligopeptide/dipeptide ABC transporter ATP-binding protein
MTETSGPARPLLEISGLRLGFRTQAGLLRALDGVDLEVGPGACLGLVGETGCGKSTVARAIMGLMPPSARIEAGEIRLQGVDLLRLSPAALRGVRGRRISLVFQEAKRALDPTATVGSQLAEAAMLARRGSRREATERATKALRQVGLADVDRIQRSYSFELSGGMAQRVMIAMAVVGGSELIIADEPTSSLDVSVQAQILHLLQQLRQELGSALILITHDLGVAAENCDRIAVMYAGRIVETAPVAALFRSPAHPYTQRLLRALPIPGRSQLEPIPGTAPDLVHPPRGCRFADRCERMVDLCREQDPVLAPVGPGHRAACHRPGLAAAA